MYTEIKKCRICGNSNLIPVLKLGNQVLTGIFPKDKNQKITVGPLELVKCQEDSKGHFCGLLQLRHSYESMELYGDHYGYRSGLNRSMVTHLHEKVKKILEIVRLDKGDIVLDIGSNDSTLLQAYPKNSARLIGIDPAANKFKKYYPEHVELIANFFSAKLFMKYFEGKKAKVVTSIAMFYDLESPMDFMRDIHEILCDDGVWVFEQSYMPTMITMQAYDTVCHEHFEYYRLKQICWMAERTGFKIVDVEFNATNGGSFSVMVAKKESKKYIENKKLTKQILAEEETAGLSTLKPYEEFKRHIHHHRDDLRKFIQEATTAKKRIFGYGASTKGNVILQYCQLTEKEIPFIAEVNEDKFGCFTPGTKIPIISEAEAKAMRPDYLLVLPWHFKENICSREKAYLESGGTLVFPLPTIETVSQKNQKIQKEVLSRI